MEKRSFEFVVFCEGKSNQWVAAALGPYIVAQGKTRSEAVYALEHTFYLHLWFENQDRGSGLKTERWSSLRENGKHKLSAPEKFAMMAKGAPFVIDGNDGDKKKAYRGTLHIDASCTDEMVRRHRR